MTNDDGPPSNQSSPYIHSLVSTLRLASHTVSVVVPHVQRSWIGKAHLVGQTLTPTYFRPGTLHKDDGVTSPHSSLNDGKDGEGEKDEWVLIDGTPASCVQLGLWHLYPSRGPIDVVISGPNYGRNTTALFSLSSGTIGGALEAAVCGKKAIALSYAFESREHDPEVIAAASKISQRLIEKLVTDWPEDVHLYSVNVPLVTGVAEAKIMYTDVLQNRWTSGSSFEEVEVHEEVGDPGEQEKEIREHEDERNGVNGEAKEMPARQKQKKFKWAPRFTDVHESIKEAGPGNDGWAVKEGIVRYVADLTRSAEK